MGKTKIEWTATPRADGTMAPGYTFNPWIGCTKVNLGCKNCFAERDNKRRKWVEGWGPGQPRHRTSDANWRKPMAWLKKALENKERYKVFCGSLMDVFDTEIPNEGWRLDLWDLIDVSWGWETINGHQGGLDWLLLTKRPENAYDMLPDRWRRGEIPGNVWIGASACDQETLESVSPWLEQIREVWNPEVLFLSLEPLISPVYMTDLVDLVDWVIVGGESGPNARSCHVKWIRQLVHTRHDNEISLFVKQMGSAWAKNTWAGWDSPVSVMDRNGSNPHWWPEDIRIREFPGA